MTDVLERFKTALADPYAIERELGSGGMAGVFLGQDRKLGRPVALKVFRPELATALGAERFVREIEIAAKLSHPNNLPLFDAGRAGGLADGRSIDERDRKRAVWVWAGRVRAHLLGVSAVVLWGAACGDAVEPPTGWPPDPPTEVQVTTLSSSALRISWNDNSSNEDGFSIRRTRGDPTPVSVVQTVGPDLTSLTDTTLTAGTAYRYRVAAFNAAGTSAWSGEVTGTTLTGAMLVLSRRSVQFSSEAGMVAPQVDSVAITNGGDDALTGLTAFQVQVPAPPAEWLTLWMGGEAPTVLRLEASSLELDSGNLTSGVFVESPVARNSPQMLTVAFTVTPAIDTQIPMGDQPSNLTISSSGSVYIPAKSGSGPNGLSSGYVYRIDPPHNAIGSAIAVGWNPVSVAVSSGDTRGYVARGNIGYVSVFDLASDSLLDTIPFPGHVLAVAIAPGDSLLYVTTTLDSMYVVDRLSYVVRARLKVQDWPNRFTFAPTGDRVFVTTGLSGFVLEIVGDSIERRWYVPEKATGAAISPDGSRLYVASPTGSLRIIDLTTGIMTAHPHLADSAVSVAISPDGAYLYAVKTAAGRVVVANRESLTVQQIIRTDGFPDRAAVTPDGTLLVTDRASIHNAYWVYVVR